MEKKLDGNFTRMLRAILNKSWRQHSTKYQLYGRLPPITKTIQVRRTRHARHCWRSRDELISDVLLWTPTYGRAKAWRPARTYIQQLCEDTGCSPEDLPEVMNDREKWRQRVRDIRAGGTRWWWWWVFKQARLFSSEKAPRYSPFLFGKLCKQNLLFPSLLFDNSWLHRWLERCIWECIELGKIARCRRQWYQFHHLNWWDCNS